MSLRTCLYRRAGLFQHLRQAYECHVMKILHILKVIPTQDSYENAKWTELRF